MIAVACDWGGDLAIGPSGDIGVAPVQIEVQQRIIRRLLTALGDYIWHTDYGAGLGSYVGKLYSSASIEGATLNQLRYEALVAMNPSPAVHAVPSAAGTFSGCIVTIQYQVSGTVIGNSVALKLGA